MGGTHRLHGILVARGPHFKKNAEISGARLIDFAPTLLYLLGQPVPRDMDGKVLSDLFKPEYLQSHPVVYDDEKEESADADTRWRLLRGRSSPG